MNKTLITLLVSGLLAANAQAAGQDNTWYGGAKLGWSNFYGVDESNSISTEDKDDDEVGAGVFAGYQINQNLGIELGYDYLGKLKYNGTRNGAVFVGALGAEYALNLDWAARLEYQYSTPYGSREDTGLRMDNGLLSLAAVYRFGQVPPAMPVAAPAPAPEPVVVDKQFTLSSDVLFDFNKATLKPEAGQALDTLYTQIEEARPKDGSATVIGYTDRLGSDAYNQKLSEQRAQTVADYLVGKGLPAGKVNVEGHGESSPVTGESCTNQSRRDLIVCLAPDRRVEVKVQGVSEVQQ